jgi:hypothetical protein
MNKLLLLVGLALVVVLAGAPTALAGDTPCPPSPPPTGTDNVVVPPGASCTINPGTTIKGNVKNYGDLLVFGPGTTIGGSVDSEPGNDDTDLVGTSTNGITVGGSIQVKGTDGSGDVEFNQVKVNGNLQYEDNDNRDLRVVSSNIGGNVKVEKNMGGSGSVMMTTIGGNLECKENSYTVVEVGNTVKGNDKCPE